MIVVMARDDVEAGPDADPAQPIAEEWKRTDIHGWGLTPWAISSRLRTSWSSAPHPKDRRYAVSARPVIPDDSQTRANADKSADEVRFLLYGEVMNQWRQLTDVRFRLMSMLPAVSIVAFIPLLLLVGEDDWLPLAAGVALAALGLSLTHGLHLYERRNDGLYDDLISRARRLEHELGVETGIAKGRLEPPTDRIKHGPATRWVFVSVKTAWLVVMATLTIALVDRINDDDDTEPPLRVEVIDLDSIPDP